MYTLIGYPSGIVLEGVIVSRTRNRMRVVAAGRPDALELKRVGNEWFSESGEKIEFEFLAADSPFAGDARPLALAAGRAGSASM
jgi:hypothetical protein